jgi:hypothetical protein
VRLALAMVAAALWQASSFAADGTAAAPQHLRYQRALSLPQGASGEACAVLDGAVFAHAENRSGDDLRVFRSVGSAPPEEVPFALTESEAEPMDAVPATVQNLAMRDGALVFDLVMPYRAYSTIELQLAAKNFTATAKVSGSDGKGGKRISLGSFALFDLSAQKLSRSTALPLAEATYSEIHVELQMRSVGGGALPGLSAAMLRGAMVPPSREAQTLYTPVATTSQFVAERGRTVARIELPKHVPVERISFVLPSGFQKSFMRQVTIDAKPVGSKDGTLLETVGGEISAVKLPASADVRESDARTLSVDAAIAANLREDAELEAAIENGDKAPLPMERMQVEMRQRKICFEAAAGAIYSLMYGDDALNAPVYDYAKTSGIVQGLEGAEKPIEAVLGPERANPNFVAGTVMQPYSRRHPETIWIGLLIAVAGLGAIALRSMKRHHGKV